MNGIYLSISDIGNNILSFVQEKAQFLCSFLPRSPFRSVIDRISEIPYLSAINWFVPIDEIVLITMYWVTAIALYYGYMIILRWIKAID